MTAIGKRISAAILAMARNNEAATASPEGNLDDQPRVALSEATLREAQYSDFAAVSELKRRWGLAPDSLENWERLWRRNPALEHTQIDRPIGWVLESKAGLVGYLGNISLLYHFGDKPLTAATGSGLVVEPAYRSVSLSLIAAYYRQKFVDLYLTTTAIETVGKIARAFRSDPLPQADYEIVLFWVLQSHPFARAVMKRLRFNSVLSYVGGMLAFLAIATDRILSRRSPRSPSKLFSITDIGVKEIGDDFQSLWVEKLNERPRLLADRSPAALRWHFDIPGDGATTRVFCCYSDRKLRGYVIVRSDVSERNGLKRSMIADILAAQDDSEILRALFVAAYDHAKQVGSEILEVLGLPAEIRRVFSESNPYMRRYPACPFYYKAADTNLHKTLADGMNWYASPFDGDTTLVPSRSSAIPPFSKAMRIDDAQDSLAHRVAERERTGVI